jgi:hypothetical protein
MPPEQRTIEASSKEKIVFFIGKNLLLKGCVIVFLAYARPALPVYAHRLRDDPTSVSLSFYQIEAWLDAPCQGGSF